MYATVIGFIVGAALPIVAGIYMLVSEMTSQASHPLQPNEARCGMPVLGALALMLFAWPISGAAGGLLGLISSTVATLAGGTQSNSESTVPPTRRIGAHEL